jgi:hypothetical protein
MANGIIAPLLLKAKCHNVSTFPAHQTDGANIRFCATDPATKDHKGE